MTALVTALRAFIGARHRFRALHGDALVRWQDERARRIVDYAVSHALFYRAHFAGFDLRDWRTLPVIDKSSMMANFDTFNTRGVHRDAAMALALQAERDRNFTPTVDGLTVGLSSGTSGHRGLFLVDRREQITWAATILARTLHAMRRTRLAFFLRSNSNLYQRLGAWIAFRYFDLTTPIADAVAALNEFQPHIIAGPPSLLAMLADEHALHVRPQRLISVAEVLEAQDEERIRRRFHAPVHQVYQCTEGLIAASCAQGSIHIQEDIVAVQLEDAGEGRVTPIVTDLWRQTQPIIRYRLNDLLVLSSSPCGCGSSFRVIERIEGRCDDVCELFTAGGARRAIFPDTLRRAILLSHDGIEDYQIVQREPGTLDVRVQLRPNAEKNEVLLSIERAFQQTALQSGCTPPKVTVQEGLDPIPPASKKRRVRRVG